MITEIESSIIFGNRNIDAGIMMTNMNGGGYAIGGMTKQIYNPDTGNFDSVVVKMNEDNEVVEAEVVGDEDHNDRVKDIKEDSNGNVITINFVDT